MDGNGSLFLKCSYQSEIKRPPIVEITLDDNLRTADNTTPVNISIYPELTPTKMENDVYIGNFDISGYLLTKPVNNDLVIFKLSVALKVQKKSN